MSMVYKSGTPDVDATKVKIEVPADEPAANPDDLLKQFQKGAAEPGKESKAADELEKALKSGK